MQIQGAEQISSAKITTLHHQLVYRLQNHALDTPEHHSDALMVLAESDQIPTIITIPRQIPKHELIKLMPLEWISNYKKFTLILLLSKQQKVCLNEDLMELSE